MTMSQFHYGGARHTLHREFTLQEEKKATEATPQSVSIVGNPAEGNVVVEEESKREIPQIPVPSPPQEEVKALLRTELAECENTIKGLRLELAQHMLSESEQSAKISQLTAIISQRDSEVSLHRYLPCFRLDDETHFCKGVANGCTNSTRPVYGNNPYTADCSACSMALHAGVINRYGGTFRVVPVGDFDAFEGEPRNGVRSLAWPETYSACMVVKAFPRRCGQLTDSVFFCCGCCSSLNCKLPSAIEGQPYPSGTNYCAAARHAGAVGERGGVFKIVLDEPEGFFVWGIEKVLARFAVCGHLRDDLYFCRGKLNGCTEREDPHIGTIICGDGSRHRLNDPEGSRCAAALRLGAVTENGGMFRAIPSRRVVGLGAKQQALEDEIDVYMLRADHDCGLVAEDVYYCRGRARGCKYQSLKVFGSNPYFYPHNDENATHQYCTAALHSRTMTDSGGVFHAIRLGLLRHSAGDAVTVHNGIQSVPFLEGKAYLSYSVRGYNAYLCGPVIDNCYYLSGEELRAGSPGEVSKIGNVHCCSSGSAEAGYYAAAKRMLEDVPGVFRVFDLGRDSGRFGCGSGSEPELSPSPSPSQIKFCIARMDLPCGFIDEHIYYCRGRKFRCTAATSEDDPIHGCNPYASQSNYCQAAVHSGMVNDLGGMFCIVPIHGQREFRGDTRHSVTSTHGAAAEGYLVCSLAGRFDASTMEDLECGLIAGEVYVCKGRHRGCMALGHTPLLGQDLWGNNPYAEGSHKCKSAVHSGVVGENGGVFRVKKCQERIRGFKGGKRNGVESRDYGAYEGYYVEPVVDGTI